MGLKVDIRLEDLPDLQSPKAILATPHHLQADVNANTMLNSVVTSFRECALNSLRDATIRLFALSLVASPTEVRAHLEPAVTDLQADSIVQAKALLDLLTQHHRGVGHITSAADCPQGTLCELFFCSVFRYSTMHAQSF